MNEKAKRAAQGAQSMFYFGFWIGRREEEAEHE
jgi:hypothetical protein